MKTHNERVISEEHWNDPEDIHESHSWACMICSAPDLNPDNHVMCEMIKSATSMEEQDRYELVEVICNTCWENMDREEQQDWIDYFDTVIEP